MIPALKDRRFADRVRAAGKRRVFLSDFDGTLALLAQDFLKAKTAAGVVAAIERLRAAGWTVVILTGRGLKDLKSRFGMRGVVCGGNHGWEWTGGMRSAPGQPSPAEKRAVRAAIRKAVHVLRSHFAGIPGVQVEHKLYFAGVHYRLVSASKIPEFNEALARAKRDPRLKGLRWRQGKKIWELLSQVRWGKGEGTRAVIRHYQPDLMVAAGDDATDEEMFAALRKRDLAVKVGVSDRSAAKYYVRRQADMLRLMKILADCSKA